jgi:hypothetical protein
MAAKLTRLTHEIAIHLQPEAESCTICSSHSRRSVRKLLDTPSYIIRAHTFGITRWEATHRVLAAKLTRFTHKIAIQLHLVAESCTICSSRFRRPVRKLLVTPSYAVGRITTSGQNKKRKKSATGTENVKMWLGCCSYLLQVTIPIFVHGTQIRKNSQGTGHKQSLCVQVVSDGTEEWACSDKTIPITWLARGLDWLQYRTLYNLWTFTVGSWKMAKFNILNPFTVTMQIYASGYAESRVLDWLQYRTLYNLWST